VTRIRPPAALRLLLLPVLLAAALVAGRAAAGAPVAGQAPPLGIDLDQFDHLKQTVALPNGITLGYVEFGNPKGRPVLLIHGYTDNARDWVPLVPFLNKDFRLILVDIRGHGSSSKPECCYALIDFAYDIKLLLDALGIERADVVGHSLGSMITQYFAEFWPERTGRVVLVSSTAGAQPGARRKGLGGMDPHQSFRAQIAALSDPLDPESAFMRWWYASPTPVDEEFLRRQRRDAAAIPIKVWRAVLDQGVATVDLRTTLPALKAPTLLMWGAKDFIFKAPDRAGLTAMLPQAKVIVYPDYGHNPFWENPERVGKDINAFLAE